MKRKKNCSGKGVIALGLSVVLGFSAVPIVASATEADTLTEYVIKGGEDYHGYVEVPYDAPESIYEGPAIEYGTGNMPASYDARDYGHVTSIKRQNPYGSCWSFATMGALESSLLSQGIYDDIDLAEYHLITHTFNGVTDPLGGLENDSITYGGTMEQALDAGGNVTVAYHVLKNWMGAVEEEDAVYPGVSGAVENLPLTTESAYLNDIVHLQQAYLINKSDTPAIKQAIMDYGAVTASFFYSDSYLNGVAYYNNNNTNSNHGVLIVGWDDNYDKNNFKSRPSANGAWLVKNSWGTWFADEGYCWLSYEDTSLQDTLCALVGESADNYDNNYQYDGSYMSSIARYTQATAANVFKVQNGDCTESLDAIAFEIGSANVNYSIQIYTDMTNATDPTSGTAMLTQPVSGTAMYQGYHTIKLPQSVILQPNQKFSVVIDFDKNGEEFIVPTEGSTTWNNITFVSNAEANQSLMKYNGYSFWWDIGSSWGGNLRIKAFTNNTIVEADVTVSGVEISPQNPSFYVGETKQLTAVVSPENATNKEVTWSSSNPSIATVDSNGLVTGIKEGNVVITATTVDGGLTDTVNVSVMKVPDTAVTSVTLTPKGPAFYVGGSKQLTATVSPADATNKAVTWSSSNPAVATVDANGLVTGLKAGSTNITVTTVDGGYTDTTKVSIMNYPVSSVSVTPESAELYVGETTQLTAEVLPAEATIKEVTWSSSNPAVASVDTSGLVTAIGQGEASIIVTTIDSGCTATCDVTVKMQNGGEEGPEVPNEDALLIEFVKRMYTVVLNREAEDDGVEFWVDLLKSGKNDGEDIAKEFFNGNEFIGRNLSNTEYIEVLYATFFARVPDESGMAFYMEMLENGTSRDVVLDGCITSAEFNGICDSYGITAIYTQEELVTNFVARMYTEALNREADAEGVTFYVNRLLKGGNTDAEDVAKDFINGTEFINKNLNNSDYLTVLYHTFFDREPDEGGFEYKMGLLESGVTREAMLDEFITSGEFNTLCDSYGIKAVYTREELVGNFVERMYTTALDRPAEEEGAAFWTNALLTGTVTGAQVADNFISGQEFTNKGLSDREYVVTLYATLYNREAPEGDIEFWADAASRNRRAVLIGFIESGEFIALCESYGIAAGEIK